MYFRFVVCCIRMDSSQFHTITSWITNDTTRWTVTRPTSETLKQLWLVRAWIFWRQSNVDVAEVSDLVLHKTNLTFKRQIHVYSQKNIIVSASFSGPFRIQTSTGGRLGSWTKNQYKLLIEILKRQYPSYTEPSSQRSPLVKTSHGLLPISKRFTFNSKIAWPFHQQEKVAEPSRSIISSFLIGAWVYSSILLPSSLFA